MCVLAPVEPAGQATEQPEILAAILQHFQTDGWKRLDAIEEVIEALPPENDTPLTHLFTPGLYTRQIVMPKDKIVVSRIHLREHPFVVLKGVVSVWDEITGWVTLRAGHLGVTKPGTRRLLYIHEETTWATFHVTDLTDPDAIVLEVTYNQGKYASLGQAAAQRTKEILP